MKTIQWQQVEGDLVTVVLSVTEHYRAEIALIESQGRVDRGSVFPDVNGRGQPHWRYQSPGGKRRYVRKCEVKELRAACGRGKAIKELERQYFNDLERVLAEARRRGLGGDGLV